MITRNNSVRCLLLLTFCVFRILLFTSRSLSSKSVSPIPYKKTPHSFLSGFPMRVPSLSWQNHHFWHKVASKKGAFTHLKCLPVNIRLLVRPSTGAAFPAAAASAPGDVRCGNVPTGTYGENETVLFLNFPLPNTRMMICQDRLGTNVRKQQTKGRLFRPM